MLQLDESVSSTETIEHLKLSLQMVFSDAVILAHSSVEAVADTQDGSEEGAAQFVTDLDAQLDRLGT